MGSRFSSSSSAAAAAAAAAAASIANRPPTVKVINADVSLKEYSQPVDVSHILVLNHHTFLLCNANGLFYGLHIQALDASYLIGLGKLCFLLPAKRLNHLLTAAEMAALDESTNSALANGSLTRKKKNSPGRRRWWRNGLQVIPVITTIEPDVRV